MDNNQDNKKKNDNRGKKQGWLLVLVTTLLTSFIVLGMLQFSQNATTKEISYSEFLQMIDEGKVEEVVFESQQYTIIPKKEEEKLIIRQNISGVKPDIKPILTKEEILEARKVVREVYLDEKIERYIVDIVFATRFPQEHGLANLANMISFGASPRASISLALAARAYAFIKRRGYVIPEDIRAVCHDVMRHRIGLSYEAEANNLTAEEVISEILNKVEVP